MDVQDPPGKAVQKRLAEQAHVAGENDELHAALPEPLRQLLVSAFTALELGRRERASLDAGLCGAVQAFRLRVVGGDRDDRQAGVEQRLQVRSLAADQHADHRISPITRSPPA